MEDKTIINICGSLLIIILIGGVFYSSYNTHKFCKSEGFDYQQDEKKIDGINYVRCCKEVMDKDLNVFTDNCKIIGGN